MRPQLRSAVKSVSRPYRTVLTFSCLISWNFLTLYLFSLKSKNVFMIGGQMLLTTFNTLIIKVWIFLWRILTLLLRCRSSWNALLVSIWAALRDLSWIQLIKLFDLRELNIHINGQQLKWDFMTAFNTRFFISGFNNKDILFSTPNFYAAFLRI